MKRRLIASCLTAALLGSLALPGCSNGGETSGTGGTSSTVESNLEIFSWWIAPGEVEALDALLGVFTDKNPDVAVANAAAVDASTQRERLKTRLETGEPPDSFQALSGVDLLRWVDKDKMMPLDAIAKANDWSKIYPQALLDIISKDGKPYGVPLNIERDNNLYYSKAMFAEHQLDPPETLAEVYAACDKLRDGGVATPLAVPAAGWVLALVTFETLMPTVTGGEFYKSYFSGTAVGDDPKITQLFTELKAVLECSNVATATAEWGAGGDALVRGDAAMYVMGDWGKAYLQGSKDADGVARKSWVAGTDFGVVPGLGSAGYFTFNATVFGLPTGAPHPKAARAFLDVVGSKEGQLAFNPIKGSLPARTDVELSDFDAVSQQDGADFKAAAAAPDKLLPGYASLTDVGYQDAINPSLLVFAVGGERARALDTNVPEAEAAIQAFDMEYIIGKMRVAYPLLKK